MGLYDIGWMEYQVWHVGRRSREDHDDREGGREYDRERGRERDRERLGIRDY